jgi:ketosteroid isomerase-like protein
MASNEELARRGMAAWSRGDFDAALADMHPEIEWTITFRLPDMPPDKDVYRGHEELRTLWEAFKGVWDTLTTEIEEILYDEGDTLITRNRFVGRGSASGIEVDRTIFYLLEIRDEKLLRVTPFDSEAEARQAVGADE